MLDLEKKRRRDYLRHNKNCEYCATWGRTRPATVVVKRQIGDKEYYVALCDWHKEMLEEIESEG